MGLLRQKVQTAADEVRRWRSEHAHRKLQSDHSEQMLRNAEYAYKMARANCVEKLAHEFDHDFPEVL